MDILNDGLGFPMGPRSWEAAKAESAAAATSSTAPK